MIFSIALLIVIIFIAFRLAPVENKEHAAIHGAGRLDCWQRWPFLAWIISPRIFMPQVN